MHRESARGRERERTKRERERIKIGFKCLDRQVSESEWDREIFS